MADEENYDENDDVTEEPYQEDDEPVDDDGDAGGSEEKDEEVDDKAPLLRDWMVRKKCWCSEFFDVLVEYGYDEPSKIKTIEEDMFEAMKAEIFEEFTNVDRAAVARFEKMWKNRIGGPRPPSGATSPSGRGRGARRGRGRGRGGNRRSPQPSPRREQRGAGFSGGAGGGGDLKRWMKQKDCFKLELFEFLRDRKQITTVDQIAALMSKDVKVILQEALSDYIQSGRSGGMERKRFENNSKKFVKAHRDVHGVDHILDQDTLNARATIWDSAEDPLSAQAPELRTLLQREEFNVRALLEELVNQGITTPDQLLESDEPTIDNIINTVTANQSRELQTKLLRDRLEKKLAKFRVYWVNNSY